MKHLIDAAQELLHQPVWNNLQTVRTCAAGLLATAEEMAHGDYSDEDAPLILEAQTLASDLLTRFKTEQRQKLVAQSADVRRDWQALPNPAQRIITGAPSRTDERTLPTIYGPGIHPRSYIDLFGSVKASPWQPGEFASTLGMGLSDSRLIPFRAAMGENAPGYGGFLIPMELERRVLDFALHGGSIVMSHADVTPMTTRTKLVASYDGQDQSSTLFGFTFQWLKENVTATPGSGQVRALTLTAWPGGIYLQASNEIAMDAPDFERDLEDRLRIAIGEALDYQFLVGGTGAGEPLSILNSPALIAVTKETDQDADTVTWDNVTSIYSRHSNPTQALWLVSPSVLTQLLTMTVVVGAGGSVMQQAVSQGADGTMSMLGRPILPTHKCPVLGEVGDIGLYDFSAYYVGLRQGIGLEASAHVGFLANQMTYRAIVRIDGQSKLSKPITGRDNQTYSPFVTVEARA